MKKDYDFSSGERGAVASVPPGKTRVTIPLDDDVLEWFRTQVHEMGGGSYEALINAALREYMQQHKEPLEELLRRVIREEMGHVTWTKHGNQANRAAENLGGRIALSLPSSVAAKLPFRVSFSQILLDHHRWP